jgi:hypothetical protein
MEGKIYTAGTFQCESLPLQERLFRLAVFVHIFDFWPAFRVAV